MHTLIVGNTGSGKSIYAKAMANDASERGEPVIVFDPTLSTGWPANARKYADPELFLSDMAKERNAYVFIDESADVWAHDEDAANQLIYRGRHRGLYFFIIAQRSRMVRPNARNQCRFVVAFRQSYDDAKILASEYHPDLAKCDSLPELSGMVSDGFTIQQVTVAFDPNRIVRTVPIDNVRPLNKASNIEENGID